VQPDGTVGDVRVTKALNPGLDQEAIKAVKQWRFKPGHKDGKAVPVRVTLEMTFTLR
jgi:protein TonB